MIYISDNQAQETSKNSKDATDIEKEGSVYIVFQPYEEDLRRSHR